MTTLDGPDTAEAAETIREAADTAMTKLAADICRVPTGTRIRLELMDGGARTGAKSDFGSQGVQLDGGAFTRFSQVRGFELIGSQG